MRISLRRKSPRSRKESRAMPTIDRIVCDLKNDTNDNLTLDGFSFSFSLTLCNPMIICFAHHKPSACQATGKASYTKRRKHIIRKLNCSWTIDGCATEQFTAKLSLGARHRAYSKQQLKSHLYESMPNSSPRLFIFQANIQNSDTNFSNTIEAATAAWAIARDRTTRAWAPRKWAKTVDNGQQCRSKFHVRCPAPSAAIRRRKFTRPTTASTDPIPECLR